MPLTLLVRLFKLPTMWNLSARGRIDVDDVRTTLNEQLEPTPELLEATSDQASRRLQFGLRQLFATCTLIAVVTAAAVGAFGESIQLALGVYFVFVVIALVALFLATILLLIWMGPMLLCGRWIARAQAEESATDPSKELPTNS